MNVRFAPSVMCSDFRRLHDELALFERRGIDLLHLDTMDGHFVPNISMGPPLVKAIAAMTTIPLELHLMVSEPEKYIPPMAEAGGQAPFLSVHVESGRPLDALVAQIRAQGGRPAVAINPKTPLLSLASVLGKVELVLVMCVQPGFTGQKLIPGTIEKIGRLKEMCLRYGASPLIEVDGNTTFENIRLMVKEGADVIVAGTSCLYRKGLPLDRAVDEMLAFGATL